MLRLFLLLALCVVSAAALGDRLDVTWPSFSTVPLTVDAATGSGWAALDSSCGVYGTRYIYQNDQALVIMFDSANNLAGVQVGITTQPPVEITPPWEDQGNGLWTITYFFEDPSNVCNVSPGTKRLDTLDQLALRNGDTNQYISLPLQESDIQAPWVLSHCFATMGTHYWYNITREMDCNYFYPAGVMYWDGVLSAFLVDTATSQTSSRWEHPSQSALGLFFYPATEPQCLFQSGLTLSTMHFFITNPVYNTCL